MWYFYCCFSYHALIELNYVKKWHKSLAIKQQVSKEGLSVWEAKCCLDVELFLNKYSQLDIRGAHCPIILQSMFVHAVELGWREAERLIWHSCWHGLPGMDLEADVPAIQLVGYQTSWGEFRDLFNKVYMLRRLPSPLPFGPEWMEEATGDILSSLRDHIWERRGIHRLEEDLWGATVPIPQHSCQTKPHPWTRGRDDLPDKALQEAREVHQRALDATHVLELNIERLSWEANRTKCQYPHGCSHSLGIPQERHTWSPSTHRPRRHVTFHEPEKETSSDERLQRETWGWVTRGEVEEGDLGPPPTLRLEFECFLEMPTTDQGTRDRQSFLPEPSIRNYEKWLEWWACQLDTPHWWEELTAMPGVEDVKKLAQKICTSFKVPAVRREVPRGQVFMAPPAPKSINRIFFLPDDLPYQDIPLKPYQMTLAYTQVL